MAERSKLRTVNLLVAADRGLPHEDRALTGSDAAAPQPGDPEVFMLASSVHGSGAHSGISQIGDTFVWLLFHLAPVAALANRLHETHSEITAFVEYGCVR